VVLGLAAGVTVVLAFVSWFFFDHARDLVTERLGANLATLAALGAETVPADWVVRVVEARSQSGEPPFAGRAVDEALADLVRSGDVGDAFLADRSGTIVRDVGLGRPPGSEIVMLALHPGPVRRAWDGEGVQTTPLYRDGTGAHRLAAFAPVRDADGRAVALLGLEASVPSLDALDSLRTAFLAAAGISILLAGALALVVSRTVTRPVALLASRMARPGPDGYPSPVPVERSDELGYLAARFNEFIEGLREKDVALRALAAGIAHEVRNPVAALAGNVELLARRVDDSDGEAIVTAIHDEVDALRSLVDEFLAYARPAGVDPRPVALSDVLERVERDARALGGPDHRCEIRLDDDLTVAGDPEDVRRVVGNLVRNAYEADPDGVRVRIRARRVGPRARITVEDDGPGIDPAVRDRLFEPFFTTRPDGTGLGLAIAHRTVETYGGTLEAGDDPQEGATFTLEWPLWRTS